ncbi:metalloregulator ArsR/SmtB family transcription factor [Streptomyces sp. NPDC051940]|uniref:ArsR/SmtB family transcription factor n=1 Tax=Streptomyces sp. NPDC051940 TaxID=3155675 RepID=UPI00343292F7
MPPSDKRLHDLDAKSLRALAHPLRVRLLNALRQYGPATASQLAERLGESSGATSYHLRQLAEAGLIEDAPEHGKGRERWWRPAHHGVRIENSEEFRNHPDAEVRDALDAWLRTLAAEHALEVNTALAGIRDWPPEWRNRSTLSDFKVTLTPDLAYELYQRIYEVIRSYEDRVPDDAEHARKVRIHVHGFPLETE